MKDMSETASIATEPTPAPAPAAKPARKGGRARRLALMLVVPLLLAGGATWVWFAGAGTESTENANLRQARLSVASSVSGRVVKVAVEELKPVRKGDLLFQVDPEPYRLALSEAEAAVMSARLAVEQLKAAWGQASAQAGLAAENARYLQHELERKTALNDRGVATTTDLDDARHAAEQARDQAQVAEMTLAAAAAALGGDPAAAIDDHPRVKAALAAVESARYDLAVTTVTAPSDGLIYQSTALREGAMVAAGSPLFTLVETGNLWVDANFKETQLAGMKPGQKAEVVLDIDPSRHYSATVEAIGAGTGAEFSLLPAQNATGNWVKVTQRVPVRIRLDDPAEMAALATGLSAEVTVQTGAPFLSAMAAD